ncbi:hypothetical protein BZG36_01700 [Bifiguratus adelaidae]|uniref:F-box domain-containing protein n=1 Tax=Bifiguratus adelaidae TaxID=1938954 RepID=A0A261Y4P4_9FUNG|nr:hypothetical protein BZG36_01700 [Bifiguratus adelaidae]
MPFDALPNEVALHVFDACTFPELAALACTSRHFHRLITSTYKHGLAKRLQEEQLVLSVAFDQESKWHATIEFTFVMTDADGQYVLLPRRPTCFRLFNSAVLRNPMVSHVALHRQDDLAEAHQCALYHPRGKDLSHVYPIRGTYFSVKDFGKHEIQIPTQYHKLSHHFTLAFDASHTPDGIPKQRPGERWIMPLHIKVDPQVILWGAVASMVRRANGSLPLKATVLMGRVKEWMAGDRDAQKPQQSAKPDKKQEIKAMTPQGQTIQNPRLLQQAAENRGYIRMGRGLVKVC